VLEQGPAAVRDIVAATGLCDRPWRMRCPSPRGQGVVTTSGPHRWPVYRLRARVDWEPPGWRPPLFVSLSAAPVN